MTVQITRKMLVEKYACEDELYLFTEHFPDGVECESQDQAIEMCIQFAQIFNFGWAADELLGEDARAEYEKMLAPAKVEFFKAEVLAWAEVDKTVAIAWAELDKAVAIAFAKAYWVQESTFFRCGRCGHLLDKEHKGKAEWRLGH